MLNELRNIVEEVNHAPSIRMALDKVVQRVNQLLDTRVCSVYMLDEDTGRYTFVATEGLNRASIGRFSLGKDSLVGWVAAREEPVRLEDAQVHPNFHLIPDLGEEPFHAFLGVPIIHQRRRVGVLVVQSREKRLFDETEESFLVTLAAQLAAILAYASLEEIIQGPVATDSPHAVRKELSFGGVPGAGGIAMGAAVVLVPSSNLEAIPSRSCQDPEQERHFFDRCLDQVRQDIKVLGKQLAGRLPAQDMALFDAYLHMLGNDALGGEVARRIEQGEWAQGALSQVIMEHVRNFQQLENDYLRERATDIKDLGLRILAYLQKPQAGHEQEYPADIVLVGEELTPSAFNLVPEQRIRGLVSVRGSRNSHMAIVARALGIPTVMGVMRLPLRRLENAQVIVDGHHGAVIVRPSASTLRRYHRLAERERDLAEDLESLWDVPCMTLDGHHVPLLVNTGLMSDISRSARRGAEGVGLYRTELPFQLRERFPTEEEQRAIYREHLKAFAPKMVTMRALDIGGDKSLPYFPIEEDNPFLGWRGIRVTLDHPELFLAQLRAMLKASEGLGNLRIMLPMISSLGELDEALELVGRASQELKEEGHSIRRPAIGVMIEVPAAVYQVGELAARIDFLSVGSNDLIQYLLAVDRNNVRVAGLYRSYHPAVLKALQQVEREAHAQNTEVSVCGELAGDPGGALLLMAMGYDALSMSVANLPRVKQVLRCVCLSDARKLLDQVMTMDNAQLIEQCIREELEQLGVLGMPMEDALAGGGEAVKA